jgi:hypothetical protein
MHLRRIKTVVQANHPRPHINSQRNQRIKFALFTKILIKLLDEKSGDEDLLKDARQLVAKTVRGSHRIRDSTSCCLIVSVEESLRNLVGEIHWRRAHGYMRFYVSRNPEILLPPKALHHMIGSHAA